MKRLLIALAAAFLLCGCPKTYNTLLQFSASTTPGVSAYYVWRDGVMVGGTAGTLTYMDKNVPAGAHAYWVTAYNGEQSKPSNSISVIVP
jgi:hypothetical protein